MGRGRSPAELQHWRETAGYRSAVYSARRAEPFPWQGKDDVQVEGGQQLSFSRLEPAQAGVALTLRAVPVSARVVGDGSMSAV